VNYTALQSDNHFFQIINCLAFPPSFFLIEANLYSPRIVQIGSGYLREYDTVARADNYFAEYRMWFSRRRGNERDIFEIALDGTSLFHGSCIDVIKSRLRKNLKAPASSRIMPFLKGEIRCRKKCSERLKELDRNVGETEVDQTDRRRPDGRKPWN